MGKIIRGFEYCIGQETKEKHCKLKPFEYHIKEKFTQIRLIKPKIIKVYGEDRFITHSFISRIIIDCIKKEMGDIPMASDLVNQISALAEYYDSEDDDMQQIGAKIFNKSIKDLKVMFSYDR